MWTMARFMITAPFLACMDINDSAAPTSRIHNIGSIEPIKKFTHIALFYPHKKVQKWNFYKKVSFLYIKWAVKRCLL